MIRATNCNENALGTLLKTMRKEQGLTQVEVAEGAGRNASNLCKWENNKQAVSWYIFLDYAESMGYTVDMTIREKED